MGSFIKNSVGSIHGTANRVAGQTDSITKAIPKKTGVFGKPQSLINDKLVIPAKEGVIK